MRVLIISQYWYPENGVPQRRWTWLSKVLLEAGCRVDVIAPPPHYERKINLVDWIKSRSEIGPQSASTGPSGETIWRSPFLPAGRSLTQRALNQMFVALGGLWTVWSLRRTPNFEQPDLIIGTVPALPTAVTTALAAKILRVPYVIDLRDAWPDLLEQAKEWNKSTGKRSLRERVLLSGPLQLVGAITQALLNVTIRRSGGMLVTSKWLEANLKGASGALADRDNIPVTTVRNVFPPETVFAKKIDTERGNQPLRVLYAGTLGRAQNLQNAIDAAEIAEQLGIPIELRFVGAGAARPALLDRAERSSASIEFEYRIPAGDLSAHYEWADTALVHLTDWEPLQRAVPSKTYELMQAGIHISGVVAGETAQLLREHGAGHVVTPESPGELAQLWKRLWENRRLLRVDDRGAQWVQVQRDEVAPKRLLQLISSVGKL